MNMLVAYNLAEFRKAAGLTQKQLGERLGGWSEASVSAAERSWDGKRVREFDADEIVRIADALGVPVIALLLPPPDAGSGVDYLFEYGSADPVDLPVLLQHLAPTYREDEPPAMAAYRDRLIALGSRINPENQVAAEILNRAGHEAVELLIKARDQAMSVTGDARDRAESLQREVQERYRQAMGSLVQSREELERRVDDLRMFEREYRVRQIAYLEGLLNELRSGVPDSGVFPPLPPMPRDQP